MEPAGLEPASLHDAIVLRSPLRYDPGISLSSAMTGQTDRKLQFASKFFWRGSKESNPVIDVLETSAVPSGPTPSNIKRPALAIQTGPLARSQHQKTINEKDGLA